MVLAGVPEDHEDSDLEDDDDNNNNLEHDIYDGEHSDEDESAGHGDRKQQYRAREDREDPQRKRHRLRLRKKLSAFFSALWFRGGQQQQLEGKKETMDGDDMEIFEEVEVTAEEMDTERLEPYQFKMFDIEEVSYDQSVRFPQPRSGHRIVADDLYIYSYGGFNPNVPSDDPYMSTDSRWNTSKPLFQELWRFSKVTHTWTLMVPSGTPPKELASHSAVLLNRRHLLVYGGSGMPFGVHSSNKMYLCDLNTAQWARVRYANEAQDSDQANTDIPEPGYGQAICLDRTKKCIYVVGGTNGFDYNLEVHVFNWEKKRWTKLSGTPPTDIEPRYRHELAIWEDNLWIIGGGTSQETYSMERVPVFNVTTRSWTAVHTHPHIDNAGLAHYPYPRYSHDCGQSGSTIYIVGGTTDNDVLSDLWSLNLITATWTRLPCSLPKGLYFHSVAITDEGQLSIFGGVSSVRTKERSNTIYQTWVKTPSLQTIAKAALFSTFRARRSGTNKNTRMMADNLKQFFTEKGIPLRAIHLNEALAS